MPFSLSPSSPTLSPALHPYPHAALDDSLPNPLPKDSFHISSFIPVRVCPSAPGCPLSAESLNVAITSLLWVAGFLACHSSPPPPSPARSGSRSLLGESGSDTVAEQHLPLRHMGLMRVLRPLVLSSRHFVCQRRIRQFEASCHCAGLYWFIFNGRCVKSAIRYQSSKYKILLPFL